MTTVFEISGAFSGPSAQPSPRVTGRFVQTCPDSRAHKTISTLGRRQAVGEMGAAEVGATTQRSSEALSERTKAWVEAIGFSLALLFVAGLVVLGVWATMLWADSIRQAQTLTQPSARAETQSFMVQNVSPFLR